MVGGSQGSLLPEEMEEVPVFPKLRDDAEGLAFGADCQNPGDIGRPTQSRGGAMHAGQECIAETKMKNI